MTEQPCKTIAFTVLSITFFLLFASESKLTANDASQWSAGVAKIAITPKDTMWMAGYAARNKPAEGSVQDLYAKAVVLKDGQQNTFVLVTLDLISVPYPIRDFAEAAMQENYDLPPSALMINCSHTHCGREIRTNRWSFDGIPAERLSAAIKYVDSLNAYILSVIDQAMVTCAPSKVSFCRSRCGFAMNRRRTSTEG